MSRPFLLQMAGAAGAGKTTLAFAIGKATGAVVIDKDIIKAGMLDSGVPEEVAGPAAYDVFLELGGSLLSQGLSVVLDSPANFTSIRDRGRAIAGDCGAEYYIIRCLLTDLDELQRRMDGRTIRSSQPRVAAPETYVRPGPSPLREPHLALDMSRPLNETLEQTLAYIGFAAPLQQLTSRGQS
ncbi:MAG TPA: AAA family ATPase [Dehalococcoidia bacterium]|nr:AAA family ATPase [Dehalococcoidia bacterium]